MCRPVLLIEHIIRKGSCHIYIYIYIYIWYPPPIDLPFWPLLSPKGGSGQGVAEWSGVPKIFWRSWETVPQIRQIEASQHFGTVGAAKH